MDIKDIPLVLTNFNQLSYLRNLINQWKFYYPDNPVWIVDNGSTYQPLLDWYGKNPQLNIALYPANDFLTNVRDFLDRYNFEYYILADPDISLPPTIPPYFLEVLKHIVDAGFHHAGLGLKTDDIPKWNPKAGWIAGDEKALLREPLKFSWEGEEITAYKAPLDTTFCLFKRSNGGWSAPMDGAAWNSSVRVFEAYHLTWYLHPKYLNAEMRNYFETAKKRVLGAVTAGVNHFNPFGNE